MGQLALALPSRSSGVALPPPPSPPGFWELVEAEAVLLANGLRPGWLDGSGASFLNFDELPDCWGASTENGEVLFEETLEDLLLWTGWVPPAPYRGKLVPFPITISAAKAFIVSHHSHLRRPPMGALWAVAVGYAGAAEPACVALVGRPVSRRLQQQGVAEITRVASDGSRHAASKVVALATKMALLQGYRRIVSYTMAEERGTSYRAAGWRPVARSGGGEWSRPGRRRSTAEQAGAKIRWEAGPDALLCDPELDAALRSCR